MNNTRRGFRSCVFDLFGTCVSRPDLEHTSTTKAKAIAASEAEEIDLVAHYAAAIASQMRQAQAVVSDLQSAAETITQPLPVA